MIYDNIARLCKERGISIRQLEKRLDLGNGIIAKWQTRSPTVAKLKVVADYLSVSLDALCAESLPQNK